VHWHQWNGEVENFALLSASLHKLLGVQLSVMCCQEEEQLFQFHMANLENACGASLKHVSAFHWDHNEVFAQFGGPLCVLPRGLATLMDHLAKGIDIRLSKQVR